MFKVNSLFLILSCASVFSQTLSNLPNMSEMQNAVNRTQIRQLPVAPALECPVNPDEYIVGVGDVFLVAIAAQMQSEYQLMVNPEGAIVVPSIGAIHVADVPLTAARKKIEEKIKERYLNSDATVALQQLRSFRVTVSGAVMDPGLVTVNAMFRASDVIDAKRDTEKQKTEIKLPSPDEEQPQQNENPAEEKETESTMTTEPKLASLRNITIRRRNGDIIPVDLQKYNLTGDLSCNPTLLDGDVIVVPIEQQKVGRIRIDGSVKAPDEFEYVAGDRLRDLLAMAHGFAIDADSSKIEMVRFKAHTNQITKEVLRLDLSDSAQHEEILNMLLQPDDRVYVRPIPLYHGKKNVAIRGKVKYPGFYALESDSVRLSQIIRLAGGFTSEASLANAYVLRQAHKDIRDPEFERLKSMKVADMTEMEREYFKVKSRELVGGMGVNFIQLFEKGDSTQDAILMDKDLIVIPAQELTVNVSGQVIMPGLFPYKQGGTLKYYINEAGGYNWNARKSKVRIIKARTGEWMRPKGDTVLDIGDTIFVPEKPERDYWLVLRDVIMVVGQVATIYLVIYQSTH